MARFSDLSQELVGMVIGQLRPDKEALFAGSLVARSWLPTCRRHLFESLAVNCKDLRRFLDFIADPSSHDITVLVHKLELSSGYFIAISARMFTRLLGGLPALKGLALSQIVIRGPAGRQGVTHWNFASLDSLGQTYEIITARHLISHLAPFSRTTMRVLRFGCTVEGKISTRSVGRITLLIRTRN